MPVNRLSVFVCVCLWLIPGCVVSETDRRMLATGFSHYSARQFDKSHAAADEFIMRNPNAENVDEAYYLRGLCRISRNEKNNAAKDLQTAIAKSRRPDLKAKANRALADIAYDNAQWQEAITGYQKSLTIATPSPTAAVHINYRLGTCFQNLGQWANAKPYFQKVITSPTDPAYSRFALARIDARAFSLQFGAFRDQPNAAVLVKQLTTPPLSITAMVTTELRDGQLFYLVRSGSYATLEEAQAARTRLLPKHPKVTIAP